MVGILDAISTISNGELPSALIGLEAIGPGSFSGPGFSCPLPSTKTTITTTTTTTAATTSTPTTAPTIGLEEPSATVESSLTEAAVIIVVVVALFAALLLTTGLETWHGLSPEHKPCVLRESINPFVTKSATLEGLPARIIVT